MNHAIWAIVPAAGIGKRMQSDIPKQYLSINGRAVLEYTVNTLLHNSNISGLVIALQQGDTYWPNIRIDSEKPVLLAPGGDERSDSVLNALAELGRYEHFDADNDWVMVHDAVRCCLRQGDIDRLVSQVADDDNGGLLALPVRDTMKRQAAGSSPSVVSATVDRENLWHALTPQYFPAISLKKALETAIINGKSITDESSAMELMGFSPILVQGHDDNIKITRPDDLRLASLYLHAQQQ